MLSTSLLVAAAVVAPALAHMQIADPPSFRSSKNPNYAGSNLIDYTLTAPLSADGSNFPCKGYHKDIGGASKTAVATLKAGQNFTVQMGGSAVHGGGGCQFSVSYDAGATWGVIYSVPKNCPLDPSYTFTVPASLPAAKDVIMSWEWWNLVGNREMYMDCVHVDVDSSASGSVQLQRMFEANIFGPGVCTVPEGGDGVNFDSPVLNNCTPDKIITPDQKVTIGSGAPAPPSDPPSSSAPPTDPTTSAPADPTPTEDPCPGESPSSSAPADPTPSAPSGGASGSWDASKVYVGGDAACYQGQMYTAKWWTQNETPGAAEVWGTASGACGASKRSNLAARNNRRRL